MFRLSKATNQQLEALNSSYRTVHECGEGTGATKQPDRIKAEIIDKTTGRVYATAYADEGGDEANAVLNALTAAKGAERPMTPAQLAVENAKLRAQIDALKAGTVIAPAENQTPGTKALKVGKAAVTPKIKITATATATKPAEPAPASDELSAADLANALKARGLPLPDGDKRTNEWKEAATAAIDEFDAKSE